VGPSQEGHVKWGIASGFRGGQVHGIRNVGTGNYIEGGTTVGGRELRVEAQSCGYLCYIKIYD